MATLSASAQIRHQEKLLEELGYRFCVRDERAVLDGLRVNGEIDEMYTLETATVVDEFFCFLRELGVWKKLEEIEAPDRKRKMLPLLPMILLYFLKILSGIKSMNSLPDLLFANRGLMRLVGFNGRVLENGLCQRGDHSRKGEKRSIPLCPDTLRNNLVRIPQEMVSDFFNEVIRALAKFGAYGRRVRGHIDASALITTDKGKDAGRITQKRTICTKSGELREFDVNVHGWKFTTLWDAKSGLPLAVGFGKIDQGDRQFTLDVIDQARKNLKESGSAINEVALDGGYLDGPDLYKLASRGLTWITRGWTSLNVVKEAVELAQTGGGVRRERTRKIFRGKGRNKHAVELRTRVVGISGLESFTTYGPEEISQSAANRRDFESITVNAVVVEEWDGKIPDSPEVYITNGSVDDPLSVFNAYDERSEIENRLHREVKQSYLMERLPQKSEAGAYVHVYFVMALYALARTFRAWVRQEEDQAMRGRGSSLESFRARIKRENTNIVIVFDGEHYGIFDVTDLMSVAGGMKFRKGQPTRTWEEIYIKYTSRPP